MCFKLCSRAPRISMAAGALERSGASARLGTPRASESAARRARRLDERAPGVRGGEAHDVLGRARADHAPARVAALGTQIDDPIRGAHDVEVVLDHEQRVSRLDQPAERAQ